MIKDWFLFLVIGRVIIFFLQRFPFSKLWVVGKLFREGEFFGDLLACDLCLGLYIFGFFSWVLNIDFLVLMGFHHVVFISELVTGAISSLVTWLIRNGWQSEFSTIEMK